MNGADIAEFADIGPLSSPPEMGLIITSEALNHQVRVAIRPDFSPRNAWRLEYFKEGRIQWVSDDLTLNEQPAGSFMQRIEDWFFAHLPIEGEM